MFFIGECDAQPPGITTVYPPIVCPPWPALTLYTWASPGAGGASEVVSVTCRPSPATRCCSAGMPAPGPPPITPGGESSASPVGGAPAGN